MDTRDAPYALASAEERQRRRAMLGQPHIEPLVKYLGALQAEHPGRALPCFDPCDGGVRARALLLLEAPSRRARGTGFISRDNPDVSARNLRALVREAQIAREDTLLWNIVPWYVGDGERIRAVERSDIREALPHLRELIGLLPRLEVIVLVGRKAQSAHEEIQRLTPLPTVATHHPSARSLNARPWLRQEIKQHLAKVAARLGAT